MKLREVSITCSHKETEDKRTMAGVMYRTMTDVIFRRIVGIVAVNINHENARLMDNVVDTAISSTTTKNAVDLKN